LTPKAKLVIEKTYNSDCDVVKMLVSICLLVPFRLFTNQVCMLPPVVTLTSFGEHSKHSKPSTDSE
jgi:hypothetical protein